MKRKKITIFSLLFSILVLILSGATTLLVLPNNTSNNNKHSLDSNNIPTAQVELTTKNTVSPFSFNAKLTSLVDANQAITAVNYKLWSATNSDGSDLTDTGITANGTERNNNFEAELKNKIEGHVIDPSKYYLVKATVKYNLGEGERNFSVESPSLIQVDNRTPPVIKKIIISPRNATPEIGHRLAFEARLDDVVNNDPRSTIKNVIYELWVASDANGTDATTTNITAIGLSRDYDYEGLLKGNSNHPIYGDKWYSVKAIVIYNVGGGDTTFEPEQSDWIQNKYFTPPKISKVNFEPAIQNQGAKQNFFFKVSLDNVADNDPRSTIDNVRYRLRFADDQDETNWKWTEIRDFRRDKDDNFSGELWSNWSHTINQVKWYSVSAQVNYTFYHGGQTHTIYVDSPWVKIIVPPKLDPRLQISSSNGKIAFTAKINNLDKNDPNSYIKSIYYQLFVIEKGNPTPIDTGIFANSSSREKTFEVLLESNAEHTIKKEKTYFVRATAYYDLGDGNGLKEVIENSYSVVGVPEPDKPDNTENKGSNIGLYVGVPIGVVLIVAIIGLTYWKISSKNAKNPTARKK